MRLKIGLEKIVKNSLTNWLLLKIIFILAETKISMDNIIDKIKAIKRDEYKADYVPGSRNNKKPVNKKSKMKVGDAGIDCLTK